MKSLDRKRERTLLFVFVAALVAAGGAFGAKAFVQKVRQKKEVLEQKQTQLAEARRWLDERQRWLDRMSWLAAQPPPRYEGERTEAAFVEQVQSSLNRHGIQIVEQRIQETRDGGQFVETGIDLVLTTSLENLVRWLHETQRAEAYRVVDHLRLKSDASGTQIRAEVSLAQLCGRDATGRTAHR